MKYLSVTFATEIEFVPETVVRAKSRKKVLQKGEFEALGVVADSISATRNSIHMLNQTIGL
ncbi:hypothetical protein BEI67_20205 (plasmid) [Photobacterium damselae subsp. piscicida]|nr:hypothetical protein BEI67_20205 [Photobacterium damselae subsp. piscicida]